MFAEDRSLKAEYAAFFPVFTSSHISLYFQPSLAAEKC